jgi:cation transport ATPase
MNIVASLIKGVTGPVVDYFKQKTKLKYDLKLAKMQGAVDIAKAKAQMSVKQLEADHNWESQQIANSGWKDEWVLILLSIPLVLVFFPMTAPYIFQGFAVLATTPDWYRWLIMLIFTAIYGIRIWRRKM